LTKEEVLTRLAPVLDLSSKVFDTSNMKLVVSRPDMEIHSGKGKALPIPKSAQTNLYSYLGLSTKVGESLSEKTLATVAGELMAPKGHIQVITKQGEVVDFTEANRPAMDPHRVLSVVQRTISAPEYDNVFLMDSNVVLDVVGHQEKAVARGDMVRAGTTITFSPTGVHIPEVRTYVRRLACTNGMTSDHFFDRYQFRSGGQHDGSEGDDVWQWFRKSISSAVKSMGAVVAEWQRLSKEAIRPQDRALIIEELLKQAGLGPDAIKAVRSAAIEHPPRNAYEAMNLITWAATHVEDRPTRIMRARRVAAAFSSQAEHRAICPTCRRGRN